MATAALVVVPPAGAQGGHTTRVSVSSIGEEGDGDGYNPSVSADGRFVAFQSAATNIVRPDANTYIDIFVRDRLLGTTVRASSTAGDVHGVAGNSLNPSISADGRYVVFESTARTLDPLDTNGQNDIFVHDLVTRTTSRVSVSSLGLQANHFSTAASISGDGRYVAFSSIASNLVPGDTNNAYDVFVHDRFLRQTTKVSASSEGGQGNGHSWFPSMSADGRYVAFESVANNLIAGDTNGVSDVFVHDRDTKMTTRVSVDSADTQSNGASTRVGTLSLVSSAISSDGRYVAFQSEASNLVAGDTNGKWDIFRRDRQTGETIRVSVADGGTQSNGDTLSPSIIASGQAIEFQSLGTNLVPGDTNNTWDIFVRYVGAGATERVSVGSDGQEANSQSRDAGISADGNSVVFSSFASNLVTGDENNKWDAFARDQVLVGLPPPPPLPKVNPKFRTNPDGSITLYNDVNDNDTVDPGEEIATTPPAPSLPVNPKVQTNPDGSITLYDDKNGNGQVDPGEELVTTPPLPAAPTIRPKAKTNPDGSITLYNDVNDNDTVDPGEEIATTPPPPSLPVNPKVQTNPDGSITLYDDKNGNGQVDPGEELVTTPPLPAAPTVRPKAKTNPDGSITLYNDVNDNDTVDPGEELVTTPPLPAAPTVRPKAKTNPDGSITLYNDVNDNDQVDEGEELARAPSPVAQPKTARASETANGDDANGNSVVAAVSADGRYVAYHSTASNLVPDDTNNTSDVFVHDRETKQTKRISVSSSGVQSNGASESPTISADGRYVAFHSHASNLVSGDTNGVRDSFMHDLLTGTTLRLSVSSSGAQADGDSPLPQISGDGNRVAFQSLATNLVSGDTNATWDVFVRDLQAGTTARVSVSSVGVQANDRSLDPAISFDGRNVAFQSRASNLVLNDTNNSQDVFLHHLLSGATTRVSVGTLGLQGNWHSGASSLSATGRYVTFQSIATNLVPGDANNLLDVFVHDRFTLITTRVSVSYTGLDSNGDSVNPSISPDGCRIAYESAANNVIPADNNGSRDIFIYQQVTRATTSASVGSDLAQGNGDSVLPAVSAAGRFVAFHSAATNLVQGDGNMLLDVFFRDLGGPAASESTFSLVEIC